jgi:hypothetical protein
MHLPVYPVIPAASGNLGGWHAGGVRATHRWTHTGWIGQSRSRAPEVMVNPGGDAGWDGPPLDIQVPDDARELERDVLAYHREQRAVRRRRRLRRIMPGQAGIMPLMASILAVCLVAGMMLSVFTITPTDGPGKTHPGSSQSASPQPSPARPSSARPSSAQPSPARPSSTRPSSARPSGTAPATGAFASPASPASRTQLPNPRPSGHTPSSGAPRVQSSG